MVLRGSTLLAAVLAYCGGVSAFSSAAVDLSVRRSALFRPVSTAYSSGAVATPQPQAPLQHVLRNVILKKAMSRRPSPAKEHLASPREEHSNSSSSSKPQVGLRVSAADAASTELMAVLLQGLPYLRPTEHAELQRALAVALRVQTDAAGTREGRRRVEHAVNVCLILGELEMDVDTLLACLMAGSITPTPGPLVRGEAQGISARDMQRRFGRRVARLVQSYEHVNRLEDLAKKYMAERALEAPQEEAEQMDKLRNLILTEAVDWRVVILRVASHLQRVRRATAMRPTAQARAKQIALSHESFNFHAPLAHRLGIHQLTTELQDLAFQRLYPRQNAIVRSQMEKHMDMFDRVLDQTAQQLTEALEANDAFMSQVESVSLAGRTKEPYSMWRKMLRLGIAADEVLDAVALRVVFKARRLHRESDESYDARSKQLCYAAMDIVRSLYTTMEPRVKDYIKEPKPNGYRSLHVTALMQEPDDDTVHPFEVQVRTFEMHQQAEFGVAAHWTYKGEGSAAFAPQTNSNAVTPATAGGSPPPTGYSVPASVQNGKDFVNWLHHELQKRKVFVFGPDGLIWDFDKSATAADISNLVAITKFYNRQAGPSHVDVAVEGQKVDRGYVLRNGDSISIVY